MTNHSLTVVQHVLRNPEYVHKIVPDWFFEKADWQIKTVIGLLKDDDRLFSKGALIEKFKNSNFNVLRTDLEKMFDTPMDSFDSSFHILKTRYTKSILKYQIEIVQEMLSSCEPKEIVAKILSIADSLPAFEKEQKGLLDELEDVNPNLAKIHTVRRPALKRLMPLYKSIIVIGGDSGHHKTNNAIDILCNALDANEDDPNYKVIYFSKEMDWDEIRDRVLAKKLHVPFEDILSRKVNIADVRHRFQDKFDRYVKNFKIIPPDSIKSPIDIAEIIIESKPKVWAVDYIQLLADERTPDVNSAVRSSAILLKAYARMFGGLGILLSQVRKRNEMRKLLFPQIDDCEYAGSIKHLAHSVGMCWWAYKHDNSADMSCYITSWQKVRNNGVFSEVLEVEPAYCDMHHSPKFFTTKNELKSEFYNYLEM